RSRRSPPTCDRVRSSRDPSTPASTEMVDGPAARRAPWDGTMLPMTLPTFAEVLAMPGVREERELRGRVGFMAYHGGGLEEMTDVIARHAAESAAASYYGVVHPAGWDLHLPSTRVTPADSEALSGFLDHVDAVITVHGFGRRPLLTSILLG